MIGDAYRVRSFGSVTMLVRYSDILNREGSPLFSVFAVGKEIEQND